MTNAFDTAEIERIIGYTFQDKELLKKAFTHASACPDNYQRLEFLGDSLLNFIVSQELYTRYPELPEGVLTERRKAIVSKAPLGEVVEAHGLEKFVIRDKHDKGALSVKNKSDIFESIAAAILLDGGMEQAKAFVLGMLRETIDAAAGRVDYKSRLNEVCAGGVLEFRKHDPAGKPHDPVHTVDVYIDGQFVSRGTAGSLSEAGQFAARAALLRLERTR